MDTSPPGSFPVFPLDQSGPASVYCKSNRRDYVLIDCSGDPDDCINPLTSEFFLNRAGVFIFVSPMHRFFSGRFTKRQPKSWTLR